MLRTKSGAARLLIMLTPALLHCGLALAQSPPPSFPDAKQSDPQVNGVMQGFPPPPDKIVRFSDGSASKFPATRWSFNHLRDLMPSTDVSRGERPVAMLPREERDLGSVKFTTMDGAPMTFEEALQKTYADGIVVLHKGTIVYERYFGAGAPTRPHTAFSLTKSFVGTLATMLIVEGKLDATAPVTRYVPELQNSAYGDATVRQALDMLVNAKYSENYADPNAEIWNYSRAGGWIPARPDYTGPRTYYDFLVTLQKQGEPGQTFAYNTVTAEVLAWIVKRATGQRLSDLMSEKIWSKIGAEKDAYFVVDSIGTESGGGGLATTLRDLARFGETMRNKGQYNGRQIIAAQVVEDITKGGDKEIFAKAGYKTLPGWSYRAFWWVTNNDHGAYTARGIYGQALYIDPKAEMVIARYASLPVAANAFNDPISLPAYAAVADELMRSDARTDKRDAK
ncbi:MAG: serine hydrolase [Methylobacteriaceae bacterium]|nr:serine hydrolase [Methylobacteriaceae bacterium]